MAKGSNLGTESESEGGGTGSGTPSGDKDDSGSISADGEVGGRHVSQPWLKMPVLRVKSSLQRRSCGGVASPHAAHPRPASALSCSRKRTRALQWLSAPRSALPGRPPRRTQRWRGPRREWRRRRSTSRRGSASATTRGEASRLPPPATRKRTTVGRPGHRRFRSHRRPGPSLHPRLPLRQVPPLRQAPSCSARPRQRRERRRPLSRSGPVQARPRQP